MTERHSFLRAIRESPDDDTPRLVYADWLEEHGESERAELVRVQVEMARGGGDSVECKKCKGKGIYTIVKNKTFVRFGSSRGNSGRRATRYRNMDDVVTEEHLCLPCNASGFVISQIALRRRERELLDALRFRDAWQEVAFTLTRGILIELYHCPWERWRSHGDLIWEKELPWRVRLATAPTLHEGGDIEYVGGAGPYRTGSYRVAGGIVSAGLRRQGDFDSHRAAILSARWPGIDFELPGVTAADAEAVLAERTVTVEGLSEFAERANRRDPTS